MSGKVRVVLKRGAFGREVLHRAVKPVMDDVQEQMEGMAQVHPSIDVYRNEDTDRANVVAACPAPVEQEHGVLTQMIGMVVA
ncbi:hypothetical protein Uis1B_2072 [Bifidobacterium margollesii]|uniref:Uncharacterized protein n=1 Tax=Bifidobacterium margollesii TaxID=2020964 RepID=A0A2N5J7B8_9BIFI|nr:hypothetical protein [Bifidobacterium margollesii]PLS30100.1 hypothetical protein Uis1B_2072 [Bifidobacterium margollesii]